MDLVRVAHGTLAIIEAGEYCAPSGRMVALREAIDGVVRGTVLYTPGDLEALVAATRAAPAPTPGRRRMHVEVTAETTAAAARRLAPEEGSGRVAALNFASARRPGGGWLSGARAQEEDLARCSALYPCLLAQPRCYEANRDWPSLLYTDHIIHSPDVPFFRDDGLRLLEAPFHVSIITAPAPNVGEVLRREPDVKPRLRRRWSRAQQASSRSRPTGATAASSWAPGAAASSATIPGRWPTCSPRGWRGPASPMPSTTWCSPCSTAASASRRFARSRPAWQVEAPDLLWGPSGRGPPASDVPTREP